MKKLILILTLIFAFALCFVACEDLADNSDEGQSQNVHLNGAPYTEEPTTEAPTTEKPTTEEPTTEEPMIEEKIFKELTTEDEYGRGVYWAIVNFLELEEGYHEPVLGDLGNQLYRNLFWGNVVTHVCFDSSNYYYVCGYFTDDHESESKYYCCPRKYTWIIVESEKDIPEKYKELNFIVAFQMNKTSSAINIATNEAVSTQIEHYMKYVPQFVDGKNIAKKIDVDFTYICFVNHDNAYHFDTTTDYFHDTYTLNCIEIEGKWYLLYKVKREDMELHFGEYYESLIGVTKDYDKDHVIIEFNDFAEAVLL